jgi:hypothetical protein
VSKKNSGIAIFEQLVPAGHKNVAGFLRFFTFISDLQPNLVDSSWE